MVSREFDLNPVPPGCPFIWKNLSKISRVWKVGHHKFNKCGAYTSNKGANLLFAEGEFFPPSVSLIFIAVAPQIAWKWKILLKTRRKWG